MSNQNALNTRLVALNAKVASLSRLPSALPSGHPIAAQPNHLQMIPKLGLSNPPPPSVLPPPVVSLSLAQIDWEICNGNPRTTRKVALNKQKIKGASPLEGFALNQQCVNLVLEMRKNTAIHDPTSWFSSEAWRKDAPPNVDRRGPGLAQGPLVQSVQPLPSPPSAPAREFKWVLRWESSVKPDDRPSETAVWKQVSAIEQWAKFFIEPVSCRWTTSSHSLFLEFSPSVRATTLNWLSRITETGHQDE